MSVHVEVLRFVLGNATWQLALAVLAFLAGVFIIPAVILLRFIPGQFLRGIVLRVLWTAGAITLPGVGYAVDHRENGQYEVNEIRKSDGKHEILRDGEWEGCDPHGWSRLGMKPFTVTYEKGEKMFADVLMDEDELPDGGVETKRETHQAAGGDLTIVGDGGTDVAFTGHVRGGYPEVVDRGELDKDGYTISMSKVDSMLELAGVPEVAFVAGEQALKNEGGDSQMSNTALALTVLVALPVGGIVAYFTIAGF